jgi:rhodanese-related sulfurtransferase
MRMIAHTIALTAIGALVGLLVNALRPDGIALFKPFVSDAEGAAECVAASTPPRVDVAAARGLLESREAVFGDVRTAGEYAAGHVIDAVHLPCSADAPRWLASVDKTTTVVVYGTGDSDADQVAQSLGANGYSDVRVLSGGFAAWQDGGGSAASGPCEACD